jgi:hypothetical protein
LELLEKQQQEQSSFDACSGIEKRHGVGYTKQNLVVRPKEAIDQSHVFGVFRKKTRQEELQFPEPCVLPNFDPHYIFTKEEEDHLDALVVSFQNDMISNASMDAF